MTMVAESRTTPPERISINRVEVRVPTVLRDTDQDRVVPRDSHEPIVPVVGRLSAVLVARTSNEPADPLVSHSPEYVPAPVPPLLTLPDACPLLDSVKVASALPTPEWVAKIE